MAEDPIQSALEGIFLSQSGNFLEIKQNMQSKEKNSIMGMAL